MLPTQHSRRQCKLIPKQKQRERKRPLPGTILLIKSAPTAPAAVLKVRNAPANIERIAYLNFAI